MRTSCLYIKTLRKKRPYYIRIALSFFLGKEKENWTFGKVFIGWRGGMLSYIIPADTPASVVCKLFTVFITLLQFLVTMAEKHTKMFSGAFFCFSNNSNLPHLFIPMAREIYDFFVEILTVQTCPPIYWKTKKGEPVSHFEFEFFILFYKGENICVVFFFIIFSPNQPINNFFYFK